MPDRTVIQWDKDDLDALGLLKVDVLALGMLSASAARLTWSSARHGRPLAHGDVPAEDPARLRDDPPGRHDRRVPDRSRAPDEHAAAAEAAPLYDLVIEVAIVRPGPIQGGMVHPYLRRRRAARSRSPTRARTSRVLESTLGVPLFQEQVMQLAVVAAGFTPGEADQLRRAMAAWRREGGIDQFERSCIDGMRRTGYRTSSPRRSSSRSAASANTAFPSRTPPASRCWSMFGLAQVPLAGGLHRGAARTASRWVSMPPPNWYRTRGAMASRCGRSMCWRAIGTARWKAQRGGKHPRCVSACAW